MRLARYLARCGVAARRKCEEIVRAGRVTVDGVPVTDPAFRVQGETADVRVDGRPVHLQPSRTILLYKPRGVICSMRDPHAEKVLSDVLPPNLGRLVPVGRLDRDSEGALLCTSDGDLANAVAHPRFGIEKVYHVWVTGRVDENDLQRMTRGIEDDGETLRADSARVLRHSPRKRTALLEIVLRTGRKREIRRMCAHLGWRVERLVRVRIGPVTLGDLAPGEWRFLTETELEGLRRRISRRPPVQRPDRGEHPGPSNRPDG